MKNTLNKWAMALILAVSAAGVFYVAGYRINVTRSLPLGLYHLVDRPPHAGDLVAFSLPEGHPYAVSHRKRFEESRRYLKRLRALPGDVLSVSSDGIRINGFALPNTKAKEVDRMGKTLPVLLASGEVPTGKGLVLSTYSENSFDGRYYGLLNLHRLHTVDPVYTFNR